MCYYIFSLQSVTENVNQRHIYKVHFKLFTSDDFLHSFHLHWSHYLPVREEKDVFVVKARDLNM